MSNYRCLQCLQDEGIKYKTDGYFLNQVCGKLLICGKCKKLSPVWDKNLITKQDE